MTRRACNLTVVTLLAAVASCGSHVRQIYDGIPKLRTEMTLKEVEELLGEPNVRESPAVEEGHPPLEYWSYMIRHRIFDSVAVYECLIFVDGRLSQWVQDTGFGGHSLHARR